MIHHSLEWCALLLAAIPAALFLFNLLFYTAPEAVDRGALFPVSVLIPARNEESSIEAAVRSVLASRNVELELIVLDDHSDDATSSIVESIARKDTRLRLVKAQADLPPGWCGKQFACHLLSQVAAKPTLCFMDADVVLAPDALSRMIASMHGRGAALTSGFPRQETVTLPEQLLIPLMHFILLGFLPMVGMRNTRAPSFAAGCGQLFVAAAAAYRTAGGHAAIRDTRHDGIRLPQAFRQAGFLTDLCDITTLARCRMYRNFPDLLAGLLKNATEGLGSAKRIVPFTVLLIGGQVLPFFLLWHITTLTLLSCFLAYLPRAIAVFRFRQSWVGALLHPVSVVLLMAIQWVALAREMAGIPVTWKGRAYLTASGKP